MGPYMRPIPIGASAAMLFSLLIAFAVSPWATRRLFRSVPAEKLGHGESESGAARAPLPPGDDAARDGRRRPRPGRLLRWSSACCSPPRSRSCRSASSIVKMLPFDNKNEFQVVVDFPEGTTLETTHRALSEMAGALGVASRGRRARRSTRAPPLRTTSTASCGTTSCGPAPHQGDVQVSLAPRKRAAPLLARDRAGGAAARRTRSRGATTRASRWPRCRPGPPVLQTLVAEIYGPDDAGRREVARQVKEVFSRTEGVVDVDWYVESPRDEGGLPARPREGGARRDPRGGRRGDAAPRARRRCGRRDPAAGRSRAHPARRDASARSGATTSPRSRLSRSPAPAGGCVPLSEIGRFEREPEETSIYHKNLKPVVYVTADVAGAQGGAGLRDRSAREGDRRHPRAGRIPHRDADRGGALRHGALRREVGRRVARHLRGLPRPRPRLCRGARADLRPRRRLVPSFTVPLVIMAPIPLTLVGILPAHGLFGVFFTATSMIGFIAGAGIIVRNSIILVDFIELRRARGHGALRGGARRRRGAVPADAADRGGRRRRLVGDALRPDLPGARRLDDGRRSGRDASVARGRAGPLLPAQTLGGEEARRWSPARPRPSPKGASHERHDSTNGCAASRGPSSSSRVGAGLVRPSGVLPLHRVRRRQPAAVGVHEDLPDDGDPAAFRRPGAVQLPASK